jgi:hypothetical protein
MRVISVLLAAGIVARNAGTTQWRGGDESGVPSAYQGFGECGCRLAGGGAGGVQFFDQ